MSMNNMFCIQTTWKTNSSYLFSLFRSTMSVHIRRKHKVLYMSVRYLGIKNLFSNSQLKQFHNVYKIEYL